MIENKKMGKVDAITLGNFILKNFGVMSHLKLQKLIFYCEAYHLAYFDTSLIDDEFEAWVHGPVVRAVFNQLRDNSILYGDIAFSGSIDPNEIIKAKLTTTQLDLVMNVLSDLSTWKDIELETATHKELPWIEARNDCHEAAKCTNQISKDTMKKFYRAELNNA